MQSYALGGRRIVIRYLANAITISRMIVAVVLIFTEPFSMLFNVLYVYSGIADMADGRIARKTHTESRAGETLDSIADLFFMAVCVIKILPVIDTPLWLWGWIMIIVGIKCMNLISGYRKDKTVFLHTTANRVTGLLLFPIPLALIFIRIDYIAIVVCTVATFAAIQEGYYIRKNRIE